MDKYEQDRRDAHADIAEAGAEVTLTWTTPDVVDGPSGSVTPGAPQVLQTPGLLLSYRTREIDGTSVLRSDKKLMLSALDAAARGVIPQAGWVATMADGVRYRVMDVDALAPDGHAILYWLQLRI